MRQTNFVLALLTAAALVACGGNGSSGGDQTPKTAFKNQVTFGDSLSDVGSYAVGPVAAAGGGKFTINGDSSAKVSTLTGKTWTELMAPQLGLPVPCAAMTGLSGGPTGFNVPIVSNPNCYGYAQGGARVSNPVGVGNKLTGATRGDLTVPVTTQIANHLAAHGGKFNGDEVVFVWAGANDLLMQLAGLTADATAAGNAAGAAEGAKVGAATFASTLVPLLAAGATNPTTAAQAIGLAMATESARVGHTDDSVVAAAVGTAAIQPGNQAVASPAVYGPIVLKAQTAAVAAGNAAGATAGAAAGAAYAAANGPRVIGGMAAVGTELGALIKSQIVAKGANYVVLNNLPDVATTPSGLSQDASTRGLISAAVAAYNDALKAAVSGEAKILQIDVYAVDKDHTANPGSYGLSNITTPACGPNPLVNSLGCNASNVIAGDISHYKFADTVHPTPYTHRLLASYVSEKMIIKGWL
ncbi:MAG: SGNH/GDSL hydrolase family protein [Pseudomonadota bacterium]